MIKKPEREIARKRRHTRLRKKVKGTANRPRLNVFKSLKNMYVQVIDDSCGCTLVSASTLDKGLKVNLSFGRNKKAAEELGKLIAKRAIEKGIKVVVFDRGGYKYHGVIKTLADAAREEGLEF
jgi:large subunit ribosomal protein L18